MIRHPLHPLPLALALLVSACSACSARSALDSGNPPATCSPWTFTEGVAGTQRSVQGPLAALDDGSVVVGMSAFTEVPPASADRTQWARKFGPDGAVTWDAPSAENGALLLGTARDAANTVTAVGVLNPGTWEVLGTTATCGTGGVCVYVGKLGDGVLAVSRVFSATSATAGVGVTSFAVAPDGRIVMAGNFAGSVDFGCGPLTASVEEQPREAYVVQLDAAGACQWSRVLRGAPLVSLSEPRVAVSATGDVAVAVTVPAHAGAGTLDLGAGPLVDEPTQTTHFALTRFTPAGAPVFARVYPANAQPPSDLRFTAAGHLAFLGHARGPVDLGGGVHGAEKHDLEYLTLLDPAGHEVWTRDLSNQPAPEYVLSWTFDVDPAGGFVIAGNGGRRRG
jgi:hypothetical protein